MRIPELSEVKNYISKNKINIDADSFYTYNQKHGWKSKDGNPMNNWKSVINYCESKGYFKPTVKSDVYKHNHIIDYVDEHGCKWRVMDKDNPDPEQLKLYSQPVPSDEDFMRVVNGEITWDEAISLSGH